MNWLNINLSPGKHIINRRWLGCLFVFIAGCNSSKTIPPLTLTHSDSINQQQVSQRAYTAIERCKNMIRQGDMILRTGIDFTSESLRLFSATDKTYSHCGIASIEHDSIFVYHALGGEWNPDEKLRRDRLEVFCSPIDNRGFGVFTFNFSPTQVHALDSVVRSWYARQLTFDMDFDLHTDDKLYCAEFVAKALQLGSGGVISFSTTRINNFEFMAVDNLFLHKNCVEKARIKYE